VEEAADGGMLSSGSVFSASARFSFLFLL